MKVNVLNKTNRQIVMYTSDANKADRSFPIPPRAVKVVDLNSIEINYVKTHYSNELMIR